METTRLPVEPTRIGEMGIGSFIILAGGVLYSLSCIAGANCMDKYAKRENGDDELISRGCKLHLISTLLYGSLIIFLTNASRRSPWVTSDDVVDDVDTTWLIRIAIGSTVAISCLFALYAVFTIDYCSMVVPKAIESERDRRLRLSGKRPKFLF